MLTIIVIVAQNVESQSASIIIENDQVKFTFFREGKFVSLTNITNKATGINFSISNESFWIITARNSNTAEKLDLTYLNSSSFSNSSETVGNLKKIILTWSNIQVTPAPLGKIDRLQINITLKDGERLSRWKAGVGNAPSPWSIFDVIMPNLTYLSIQDDSSDDFLVFPQTKLLEP